MPKEKINHSRPRVVLDVSQVDDDGVDAAVCAEPINWAYQAGSANQPGAWADGGDQDPEVFVTWGRDSYVQVALEADKKTFESAADPRRGTSDVSAPDRDAVYAPPLSRDEINKLIRTLRRARDQVFGRDE